MENFLYWKLQTKLASPELVPNSKEYNLYREHYKANYETRELMNEAQTLMHQRFNGWKHPVFSAIHSLTIAFVNEGVVRIKYITGEEKDLLQTFVNLLKSDHFKEYRLATFDAEVLLPYLAIRFDKNAMPQPNVKDLTFRGLKPWNLTTFDIRTYYQGAGVYKLNLKEIAYVFNQECDFIEPADEFTYYQAGRLDEIKSSAVEEIFTMVNVHRRMMGEDALKDLKIAEERVEEVAEILPSNPLEQLFETKQFSGKLKEEITKMLTQKKPTKSDRTNIPKILYAHYKEKIDVMDYAKVKKQKEETNKKREEEINEFLKEIWPLK